jgi:hypothetical protein
LLSGLPSGKVFWERQTQNRPALPFVSLHLKRYVDPTVYPEIVRSINPTGVPGDPLANPPTIGTEYIDALKLGHQADIDLTYHGTTVAGYSSVEELTHDIVHKLYLPSSRDRLKASGVAFAYDSDMLVIPELMETRFEGRVRTTLTFRWVEFVSETSTYISEVSGTATTQPPDMTNEFSIDLELS